MASLNDNLFTTLPQPVLEGELDSRLQSRFGWVRVRFTQAGLAELVFEDNLEGSVRDAADSTTTTVRQAHHRQSSGLLTSSGSLTGAGSLRVVDDFDAREAFLEWARAFERLGAEVKWRLLDLRGTDFQRSVWRRLLDIPFGARTSYGQIAADLGRPKASRAVGSAVGANPVSLLVPCHRVLPSTGKPGNYRWGADRKRALLDAEQESGSHLRALFE
jgi:O-6-methylguanine DNA methyltransferase